MTETVILGVLGLLQAIALWLLSDLRASIAGLESRERDRLQQAAQRAKECGERPLTCPAGFEKCPHFVAQCLPGAD